MNPAATEPLVGVINAGSSSVKFSFYEGKRGILTGQVDGIGARPAARANGPDGEKIGPRKAPDCAERGIVGHIALGKR
jgi:acetate kinase